MMDKETKILLFEYAIHRLIEWYKSVCANHKSTLFSHFSRLASLKLLFFVSAVKDSKNDNRDLLDIFDNFCAMQYGPVEVDVYSAIVMRETTNYTFGNRALTFKVQNPDFNSLDNDVRQRVDNAIDRLREINPALILCAPFQLVEITHKWYAWQSAMDIATIFGKGSEPMPVETIRKSNPVYV